MKPWEETWEQFEANKGFAAFAARTGEYERSVFESLSGEDEDIPRAKLASAAPDMARVLLAVEWCGCVDYVGDGGYRCCPACEGIAPDEADRQAAREDIARAWNVLSHKPDCELDAALKKAGIR